MVVKHAWVDVPDRQPTAFPMESVTDSAGRWLTTVEPGVHAFTVSKEGYKTLQTSCDMQGKSPHDFCIVLLEAQ